MNQRNGYPGPDDGLFSHEELAAPAGADMTSEEPEADADVTVEPAPEPVAEREPEPVAEREPEPVAEREPEPVAKPELEAEPQAAADAAAHEALAPGGRSPSLRVASLHLRMGQHALARAELEAFAGRGRLDEQALLDLAEVRWRSGDLVGATEAAGALLARGQEPLLALVIAAEGYATSGRPTEARRLALRAVELAGEGLESVFAGMPSGRIWPDGSLPAAPLADAADDLAATGDPELMGLAAPRVPEPEAAPDAEPEPVFEAEPDPDPESEAVAADEDGVAAQAAEAEAEAAMPAPSPADNAIAAAAAAIQNGRIDQASLLFGLALRIDPSTAAYVLVQLDAPSYDPRLALVEGDALQLLGRDAEARDAYNRAGGHLFGETSKG